MSEGITKREYESMKDKVYLNITDIKKICGCGYSKASEIVNNVNRNLKSENIYVPTMSKAPTEKILEYLGLENH